MPSVEELKQRLDQIQESRIEQTRQAISSDARAMLSAERNSELREVTTRLRSQGIRTRNELQQHADIQRIYRKYSELGLER